LKRILTKVLKYTGISLLSFVALLFILPYFFPKTISNGVKSWTNNNINGTINFSRLHLSFFRHFPSLTLSLSDFSLKGSNPFPNDTLIAASEISFGINLHSVFFEKKITINQIFLDAAAINVQVDSLGNANYNVYKAGKNNNSSATNDSSSASLNIQKIQITHCRLNYNDRSIPMIIHALDFNYNGAGDLSHAIFDLNSHLDIKALDFQFDHEDYLSNKEIHADLVTQINTNSLSLLFRQNFININKLKLDFTGSFKFLKNGYSLDFSAGTKTIKLYTLITALPPKYLDWLTKSKVEGDANLLFSLKGDYIASQNIKPNVRFNMAIRNGQIAYNGSEPLSDLQLRFQTLLPALNTDSLRIALDTLSFKMGSDAFDAHIHILGVDTPLIIAQVHSDVDLGKVQQAVGFKGIDLKGRLKLDLKADGHYLAIADPKAGQIIKTIPNYEAVAVMSNGYFKMSSLPQGISNINFNIKAQCNDGNYKHSKILISDLRATALNNSFQGHANIDNLVDYQMDAEVHSNINLAEIKNFIPLDSLELAGHLKLNTTIEGKYVPERRLFPNIKLDLDLQQGSVQTKYYPHPITQIEVQANINDPSGNAQGLAIELKPVSFTFEGKPFKVAASLSNLDDLHYKVQAAGVLDIQKIYKVFSQKDLDVSGLATMNLSLEGRQSDASKGLYSRLHNSGTLQLEQVKIRHPKYLPLPLTITQGLFSFQNDKMQFRDFKAIYGHSDFKLNGYLQNVINYALSDKATLKGAFTLHSDKILVDEFMPQASVAIASQGTSTPVVKDTSGVFMVPANLSLSLETNIGKILYDGLPLQDFSGTMIIDSARVKVKKTTFKLIGTTMNMDLSYQGLNANSAQFALGIQAKDFDVRKAYDEIKLFHDLAPAAAKAKGIVSLDYQLKGRLDRNMDPVYSSLSGAGLLSVRNVQFAGFKLLNSISSETGKSEIHDPNVKDVALKTTIKNNVITLEKVKIKMAGFRMRIEGQSSFDKKISFKIRLGLPPLGIIGIPMRVTGTSENPKVKVTREEADSLEAKEDDSPGP